MPSCPPHIVPEQAVTLKRQRPPPLEPCSGSGVQRAGQRRSLAADPRHPPRPSRAVRPTGQRPHPGPAPPRASATHSERAKGRSPSARRERPPCTSPVPGPPLLRGARPGEREAGWCQFRVTQKLGPWTLTPSQGVSPAAEPAPAPRSGYFVNTPSHWWPTPGSQPPSLPAFQRVINCNSGVEKPGQGFPGSRAP